MKRKYVICDMNGTFYEVLEMKKVVENIDFQGLVDFYKVTSLYKKLLDDVSGLVRKGMLKHNNVLHERPKINNSLDYFKKEIIERMGEDAMDIVNEQLNEVYQKEEIIHELLGNIMVVHNIQHTPEAVKVFGNGN